MILRCRLPKTLLWVLNLLLIFLIMFTCYRFLTLLVFAPEGMQWNGLLPVFLLGLRFDLRWITILLLPIVLASLISKGSPFDSDKNKKIWTLYLAVLTFIVFFFFAADFGSFSYNKTRLNASALNFVEDSRISAAMLWQSYPIGWMVVALVSAVLMFRGMFKKMYENVALRTNSLKIKYGRKWFIGTALLFGAVAYGNLSLEPLKWNEAFRFNDSFQSYLALNPLQNF